MNSSFYIASRIPSKGGLKILRTDLSQENKKYIEEKCLDIAVLHHKNALMIYPLGNGFVTALAKRRPPNQVESRIHEDIHGYITNMDVFTKGILPLVETIESSYYDWEIEEVESIPEERLSFKREEISKQKSFTDQLQAEERVGLFFSLYSMLQERKKIHLIVPEERVRAVQAACYEILPYPWRTKLYTISFGECTQVSPDMILTAEKFELQYDSALQYERVSFKSFVQTSLEKEKYKEFPYFCWLLCQSSEERNNIYDVIQGISEKISERDEEENTKEMLISLDFFDLIAGLIVNSKNGAHCDKKLIQKFEKINSDVVQNVLLQAFPFLVDISVGKNVEQGETDGFREVSYRYIEQCLRYINSKLSMSSIFREIRGYYYERNKAEWEQFQNELRKALENCPLYPDTKQYREILFLAYENYKGSAARCFEQAVLSAPYDLEGIFTHVRRKAKSERQYQRYVVDVLKEYNSIFKIFISERKITSLLKEKLLFIPSVHSD